MSYIIDHHNHGRMPGVPRVTSNFGLRSVIFYKMYRFWFVQPLILCYFLYSATLIWLKMLYGGNFSNYDRKKFMQHPPENLRPFPDHNKLV